MSHHAVLVAAGILLSRITGLVRDRVFAHYFGNSDAADAFRAAFRIPNFLQNLLGEGVLSASFIPVYAQLRAQKKDDEADRVASALFWLLSLALSSLVVVGVLAAPWLCDTIAPGFQGEKRALTISLVRILFPGAAFLSLSAWCLGILNSHRRFFISYVAPVAWNVVMIATLLGFGGSSGQFPLAEALAWGSVAGSALQFAIQLPYVWRLLGNFRVHLGLAMQSVRTVMRSFFPVFISRGVVQVSAYVDALLASLLPGGSLAALVYAQTLYTLPVSLFGMSVSAAELPALSCALGENDPGNAALRKRIDAGLRQIAFFVVPSAMAFLALGDVIAGAIYQTGQFTHNDSLYVWAILAGAAIGLLASTLGRLYSSAFYALKDTAAPLRFAVMRVFCTALFGYLGALVLPPLLNIPLRWGVVGLSASAGLCGWLEFVLLRATLNKRIGKTGLPASFVGKLWAAAAAGAAAGWVGKFLLETGHPIKLALLSLGLYGVVYLGIATILQVPEARGLMSKAGRLGGRIFP